MDEQVGTTAGPQQQDAADQALTGRHLGEISYRPVSFPETRP
jgi:hypothetical protein